MEQLALESTFIWDADSFERIGLPLNFMRIYIDVADPEDTSRLSSIISDLEYIYGSGVMTFNNLQQEQIRYRAAQTLFYFSIALTVVFFIFSILSLMITLNLRTHSRRNIFGLLRAVGLSRRELYSILTLEMLLEIGTALAIAAAASLGICFVINYVIPEFTLAFLPLREVFVACSLYLLAAISACWLPVQSFYRKTIVECIQAKE